MLPPDVKKRVSEIIICFLLLSFCIGTIEIIIRLFSLDREIEQIMYNTNKDAPYGNRVRIKDPEISWFLTGYDFNGEKLIINFEKPQLFHKKKQDDKFRILVLGDSVSEVWVTGDPDQKFPKMLETHLNNSPDEKKYEVVNISVGSYTLAQKIGIFKQWFYDWEFDLIIIQYTLDDGLGPYVYSHSKKDKDIYFLYDRNICGLKWFENSPLLHSALFRFIILGYLM